MGKKLQENDEELVVSFDFQNMNSSLGPSQCQMLLLEFCVSNKFNIQRSLQHYERKINDQMNNRTELRFLGKFACTAGARGFRQTVATSSNM